MQSFASEGSDEGPVYMLEAGQISPVTGFGMRRDTFEFYESAREGLDACRNREAASLDSESGVSVTWQGVAIGFGIAASLKLILDSIKK